MLWLAAVIPAVNAANISVTLNGTVDVLSGAVFGQTGTDLPVTTTFGVDSNTAVAIFTIADGAAEDLYGYQATGLSGVNVTFGTKMWSLPDLDLLVPEVGFSAAVWFNANLATATPTRVWFQLSDSEGSIQFGSLTTSPAIALQPDISIVDATGGGFGATAAGLLDGITTVPEPAGGTLLLAAAALFVLSHRSRGTSGRLTSTRVLR